MWWKILQVLFCMVYTSAVAGQTVSELPVNWEPLPRPYHTPSAVNPPRVIARPEGASLSVPPGFIVEEYLSGFEEPRFMLAGRHGEILLSDMSEGVIYVIRGREAVPLIESLDRPYGLALVGDWLYVAEAGSVKRYRYDGEKPTAGEGQEIISLRKHADGHSTRTLLFDEENEKLYLTVGSRSNVSSGEAPIRAAISRYNPDGSGQVLFATGIRNPVGLRWYPGTRDLWVTSHERDGLGDDLVPDYFTRVREGEFYGWPYAYTGPHEDPRHAGKAPDMVQKTSYPRILLGSHVGVLDFIFYTADQFPEKYHGGAFIALHGSWNRSKRTGYKIVFVPFRDASPLSGPEDFLTGWMLAPDRTEVWGRPVGLLQMPDGALLVSDDGAGKIWRISYAE